jgi:predicted transcriptional regulator
VNGRNGRRRTTPTGRTAGKARATSTVAGIRSLRGIAALATFGSPVRLELIDHVQRCGTASIRELAQRMGRPADALYFHVKKLLRAGALVERGRRKTGRRPEALYALPSVGLRVDPRDASPAAQVALHRGARTVLRMAERQFRSALDAGAVRVPGRTRNLLAARIKARLSPAALAELNRRVDALIAFLHREEARHAGRPCVVTLVLSPLLQPAGRRSLP